MYRVQLGNMVSISIHALLAESDNDLKVPDSVSKISIHALLAESDKLAARDGFANRVFLSTLSLRRATAGGSRRIYYVRISIHALLAESDPLHRAAAAAGEYFYPRSPCGERHADRSDSSYPAGISIHALLAESDFPWHRPAWISSTFLSTLSLRRATHCSRAVGNRRSHFYPRSPCGERPARSLSMAAISGISIHALLAESD